MDSAFGVDHGFSKSLVGGSWKKASQLSAAERKAVGGYRKLRGRTKGDEEWVQSHRQISEAMKELEPHKNPDGWSISAPKASTVKGKRGKVDVYEFNGLGGPLSSGVGGVTAHTGGKRGKTMVITQDSWGSSLRPADTLKHELAHADPKRTSYRMKQITENPGKLVREEARADAAIGHYAKTGVKTGYAGAAKEVHRREHKKLNLRGMQRRSDDKYSAVKEEHFKDYQRIHDNIHGKQKVKGSDPFSIAARKLSHPYRRYPETAIPLTAAGGVLGYSYGTPKGRAKERERKANYDAWGRPLTEAQKKERYRKAAAKRRRNRGRFA